MRKETSVTVFILDASNFVKKFNKKEYRYLLRIRVYKLLFDYFGINEKDLRQNNFGKKYITTPSENRYFNISYSHQIAVLAVSDEEIGIDVEYLNKDVSSKLWSILGIDCEEGNIAFYYRWTCTEALTKFYGIGLTNGFRSAQIPRRINLEQYKIVNNKERQCCLYSKILDDYLLTICQSFPKSLSFIFKEILY